MPGGRGRGGRLIPLVVLEVLSELKSLSPAKGEESFLLLPKSTVHVMFRQCLGFEIPSRQRTADGSFAITSCMHIQRPHLIYLCITQEGAVAFTKLQRFGFLYFRPFQTSTLPRSCVPSPHCAIFRFHANCLSIFRTC